MARRKRKLTPAEKAEKRRRRAEYKTIFVGGKQKRVKREPHVDGVPLEEFILNNADPIWLHQNEMWEQLNREDGTEGSQQDPEDQDDIPF